MVKSFVKDYHKCYQNVWEGVAWFFKKRQLQILNPGIEINSVGPQNSLELFLNIFRMGDVV